MQDERATALIEPYGGPLVDLHVGEDERADLARHAGLLPSITLSPRSLCDLEMLATGAFSPLDRFMARADRERVLEDLRLADGTVYPVPVTLPADMDLVPGLDREIALRDARNEVVAVMRIDEIAEWDRDEEARLLLGTTDPAHPLVAEMAGWGRVLLSGALRVLGHRRYHDFPELRHSPRELRAVLAGLGESSVVAFQTRNPMHRAHEELARRATESVGGTLLVHPVVGTSQPGDVGHHVRVRTYRALIERRFDARRTVLSLLPLAMRMAGPREAAWHAIIRRNHGASHFIVGRDHAGAGANSSGRPFHEPLAAQELVARLAPEIGVEMVASDELVYVDGEDRYVERSRVPDGAHVLSLSGTQVRKDYLARGRELPEWFTRPEVARILSQAFPAHGRQGFCVWLTGLPSAGKSSIADVLAERLLARGRQVTVLDGDVVRTHLSKGLGFSREDRDANVLRIGFVASEIVRHEGAVLCAAVSPYRATRNRVRDQVGADRFVEVHVATPADECERRDTKGLYAKARRGELEALTGLSDPYEPPQRAEVVLTTVGSTPAADAERVLDLLVERGFVA